MENPNTWTKAHNVVANAIKVYNIGIQSGLIGLSMNSYIVNYLTAMNFLTDEALEVVGYQEATDGTK